MTHIYEMNGFPKTVSVCCPNCGKEAAFTSVSLCRIALRKDVAYFQNAPFFDYVKMPNTGMGAWHGALYYHGLHVNSLSAITDFPEGYEPKNWQRRCERQNRGTLLCYHCDLRQKHVLD